MADQALANVEKTAPSDREFPSVLAQALRAMTAEINMVANVNKTSIEDKMDRHIGDIKKDVKETKIEIVTTRRAQTGRPDKPRALTVITEHRTVVQDIITHVTGLDNGHLIARDQPPETNITDIKKDLHDTKGMSAEMGRPKENLPLLDVQDYSAREYLGNGVCLMYANQTVTELCSDSVQDPDIACEENVIKNVPSDISSDTGRYNELHVNSEALNKTCTWLPSPHSSQELASPTERVLVHLDQILRDKLNLEVQEFQADIHLLLDEQTTGAQVVHPLQSDESYEDNHQYNGPFAQGKLLVDGNCFLTELSVRTPRLTNTVRSFRKTIQNLTESTPIPRRSSFSIEPGGSQCKIP